MNSLCLSREKDTLKSLKKEPKKAKNSYLVSDRPKISYKDFGGIESCLEDIKKLIERPFLHPKVYQHLKVEIPKGILLFGPPGCGKTSLAHAICNELNANLLKVSAPEIVSGMSGESEAKVRELFEEAKKQAPCIVFIDEIDAITPKRETAQREMERRIVAQPLTSMDDVCFENTQNKPVLVIGATNRPDSIDSALKRAGRFDREIKLGIPSEEARCKILQVFSRKLRIRGDFDFLQIARKTRTGYVGADLKSLVREAASVAIERILGENSSISISQTSADQVPDLLFNPIDDSLPIEKANKEPSNSHSFENLPLEDLFIEEEDLLQAIPKVQPSAKREGFAVVPDTTWNDIGTLASVREELRMSIVEPLRHPEKFKAVGILSPVGLLLWGPPGCGKNIASQSDCQ